MSTPSIEKPQHESPENGIDHRPLSPQARAYLEDGQRNLREKRARGEPVTERDLAFCRHVRIWLMQTEEFRKAHPSIDPIEFSGPDFTNSFERRITVEQWRALLHMAEALDERTDWIDAAFTFREGNILAKGDLRLLEENQKLKYLPENLIIPGELFLTNCRLLEKLPKNWSAKGLYVSGCTLLMNQKASVLPEIWKRVRSGKLTNLNIEGWPLEDGDMPDDLTFDILAISNIPNITRLPVKLTVNLLFTDGNASLAYCPDDLVVKKCYYPFPGTPEAFVEQAIELRRKGQIKDIGGLPALS